MDRISPGGFEPHTTEKATATLLQDLRGYSAASSTDFRKSDVSDHRDVVEPGRAQANTSSLKNLWSWWPEILASLGVLVSLGALVATLAVSRNKPLPKLPYSISINTIISFEATVFKGCLTLIVSSIISQSQWLWFAKSRSLYDVVRYDGATRGPWGALIWIFKHHVKSPLTSLAAIVIILALVIDPFIQQLIGYVGCQSEMQDIPSKAAIPRTNYFSPPAYHLDMGAIAIKIPMGVQNAVSAGIEGTPKNVDFDCSSGNCTFAEPYSTLGFCHVCEDLSSQVRFNETCRQDSNGTCMYDAYNTTSYLRENFAITTSTYGAFPNTGTTTMKTPLMVMQANMSTSWAEFLVAKTIRSGCEAGATNKTWTCQGYGAARCTLLPCVRTYQANITNNVISEDLIEFSDPMLSWNSSVNYAYVPGDNVTSDYVTGLLDLNCVSDVDKQKLAQNYTFNSTTRWMGYDYEYATNQSTENPPFPGSLIKDGCLYLYQTFFLASLWEVYYVDFFSGTLEGTVQSSNQLITAVGPRLLEVTYDVTNGSFETIDATFASMANYFTSEFLLSYVMSYYSLSRDLIIEFHVISGLFDKRGLNTSEDYVRENGNPASSKAVEGTVLHYATCVQVNWLWLIFPAVLAAITLFSLLWIVIEVLARKTPVWRSSPLAFIYRGPYGRDSRGGVNTAYNPAARISSDNLRKLEDTSRRTIVRLGRSSDVLRLEDHTAVREW